MHPLDDLDIAILAELEKNGRAPLSELARQLDSPASTIRARIQRLEQERVIRGYTVLVDHEKLGYPIKAVVHTTRDQRTPLRSFVSEAIKCPEIAKVQLLTGDTDELITIYVRSVHHLREFLYRGVMQLPGVTRTNTVIILSEIDPPYLERALNAPELTADDLDEFDFEAESIPQPQK
jgi:DNA-binding Lrp family transcriptional regulator